MYIQDISAGSFLTGRSGMTTHTGSSKSASTPSPIKTASGGGVAKPKATTPTDINIPLTREQKMVGYSEDKRIAEVLAIKQRAEEKRIAEEELTPKVDVEMQRQEEEWARQDKEAQEREIEQQKIDEEEMKKAEVEVPLSALPKGDFMYMSNVDAGFWESITGGLKKGITTAIPKAVEGIFTKTQPPQPAPTIIVQPSESKKFPVVPVVIGAGALLFVSFLMFGKKKKA